MRQELLSRSGSKTFVPKVTGCEKNIVKQNPIKNKPCNIEIILVLISGRTDGRTGQDGSYQFLRAAGAPVRRRRGRGPQRHAKIDFFSARANLSRKYF